MDRAELRRLAHVLTAAADSSSDVRAGWYRTVRARVDEAVGEEVELEAVLPSEPHVRMDLLPEGDLILRAGAAYLHDLAATSGESSARAVAATDLMDQVQDLLDDEGIHPAAPIVLAGAALEEALRDHVETHGLTADGYPGINTYAVALKRAGLLSEPDRTLAEAVAKVRNDAAHGRFELLEPAQAELVMSQVSLLLGRIGHRPASSSEAEE